MDRRSSKMRIEGAGIIYTWYRKKPETIEKRISFF